MRILLILICFMASVVWFVDIARASESGEFYSPIKTRVRTADVVFAGIVVNDNAVVPNAPEMPGAHRTSLLQPVMALKGELPQGTVSLNYGETTPWFYRDTDDKPGGWVYNHTRQRLLEGVVYIFLLNVDAKSGYRCEGMVEGNYYLDDPAGRTRQDITAAFRVAGMPIAAGWSEKLDEQLAKTDATQQTKLAAMISVWAGRADGFAILAGGLTPTFVTHEVALPVVSIPDDLQDKISRSYTQRNGFMATDYVEMARQWRWVQRSRVTWDGTTIPVAGALLGVKGTVTEYAAEHVMRTADRAVWVAGTEEAAPKRLQLAVAFDKAPLDDVCHALPGQETILIVPFRRGTNAEEGLAVACGPPVLLPATQQDRAWRNLRQVAALLQEKRFVRSVLLSDTTPSDANLRRVEQLLGVPIAPGDEGRGVAATYWGYVIQYETANRVIRAIVE